MLSFKNRGFVGKYALVIALGLLGVSSTVLGSSAGPIAPCSEKASDEFVQLMRLIYQSNDANQVSAFLEEQQAAGADISALLNQASSDQKLSAINTLARNATPLIAAIDTDNPAIVEFLINNGANPNLCNDLGQSPLFFSGYCPQNGRAIRTLLTGKSLEQYSAEVAQSKAAAIAEADASQKQSAKLIRTFSKIPAHHRGNKARAQLAKQKSAATKIQRIARGHQAKTRFTKQKSAATKIQAHTRGHQARKNYSKMLAAHKQTLAAAAAQAATDEEANFALEPTMPAPHTPDMPELVATEEEEPTTAPVEFTAQPTATAAAGGAGAGTTTNPRLEADARYQAERAARLATLPMPAQDIINTVSATAYNSNIRKKAATLTMIDNYNRAHAGQGIGADLIQTIFTELGLRTE